MCKLNVYELCEIQETLESYLKLIKWLPSYGTEEESLKAERIRYVEYLIDKCEKVIQGDTLWRVDNE